MFFQHRTHFRPECRHCYAVNPFAIILSISYHTRKEVCLLMLTKRWLVNKKSTIHTKVIKNVFIPFTDSAFISSVPWYCHGSGCQSPACHFGVPVCIPDQPAWDLQGANFHLKMFLSECLDFSPSSIIPPVLHAPILFICPRRRIKFNNHQCR